VDFVLLINVLFTPLNVEPCFKMPFSNWAFLKTLMKGDDSELADTKATAIIQTLSLNRA